jgi:hypothetical protein
VHNAALLVNRKNAFDPRTDPDVGNAPAPDPQDVTQRNLWTADTVITATLWVLLVIYLNYVIAKFLWRKRQNKGESASWNPNNVLANKVAF